MTTKHCAKCQQTKPLADFGVNAGRKDGVAVYCRPCTKAYMAAKRYDQARWVANRNAESARNLAYRQANADKLLPKYRENSKARRQTSPAKVNACNRRRQAAQRQAVPGWANLQRISLVYEKAKELSAAFGMDLQVDHIVPLRSRLVCGLHVEANLQLLDKDLNHQKRNWTWPDMP